VERPLVALLRFLYPQCSNHGEVWLALANEIRGGDRIIEISRNPPLESPSNFRVYVLEASGLARGTEPYATPPGYGVGATATAPTLHVASAVSSCPS